MSMKLTNRLGCCPQKCGCSSTIPQRPRCWRDLSRCLAGCRDGVARVCACGEARGGEPADVLRILRIASKLPSSWLEQQKAERTALAKAPPAMARSPAHRDLCHISWYGAAQIRNA
jgi:hypothetical protein